MTLLEILYGTPWWVFVVFIELVIVGLKSRHTQHISLARMSIIPLILVVWSLYSISGTTGLTPGSLSIWLVSFMVSVCLGWKFLSNGIQFSKPSKIVIIEGNWYTFPLLMGFFLAKYCIGVIHAIDPVLASSTFIWFADAAASGFISGLFTGRLIHIAKYYL